MGTPQWALEAKLAVEELHAKLQAERDKTRELQNRILLAMNIQAEVEIAENFEIDTARDVLEALDAHRTADDWIKVEATQHPLPLGTLVLSAEGESDTADDDESDRFTGSWAVGQIVSADRHKYEGWSYGVVFGNGTWVHIDEAELADPDAYLIANAVF